MTDLFAIGNILAVKPGVVYFLPKWNAVILAEDHVIVFAVSQGKPQHSTTTVGFLREFQGCFEVIGTLED